MNVAMFVTKPITNTQKALADFFQACINWRIWLLLAYQDIKLRYRRSKLGPFWLTISMAVTVYSMGFLYSHLFKMDLQTYYPYLTAGMLTWSLISGIITEVAESFTEAEGSIKQIKLPYSIYIHRVVSRNLLMFSHNILVYIPIILFFHEVAKVDLHTLCLIPGLAVIYINGFLYGLAIAIICARYPDMIQIVKSIMQVIFFMTPIMWSPAILPEKYQILAILNPFYDFVQLIRAPLMGQGLSAFELYIVSAITILGFIIAGSLFSKYRARIVYWI